MLGVTYRRSALPEQSRLYAYSGHEAISGSRLIGCKLTEGRPLGASAREGPDLKPSDLAERGADARSES